MFIVKYCYDIMILLLTYYQTIFFLLFFPSFFFLFLLYPLHLSPPSLLIYSGVDVSPRLTRLKRPTTSGAFGSIRTGSSPFALRSSFSLSILSFSIIQTGQTNVCFFTRSLRPLDFTILQYAHLEIKFKRSA